MTQTPQPATETSLQRSMKRLGECIVASCDCSAFAYTGTVDGFRTCTCNHTQHSHRIGDES